MKNGVIQVEAKKYAMRQSKDGVILSLVIHPNDATSELLSAPIGQQWIVALAPYIESPSPDSPVSEGIAPVVDQPNGEMEGSKRPATGAAKDRYKAMPSAEQARTRAAMLPKDRGFQAWVARELNCDLSEEGAAEYIRDCIGSSRSMIAADPEVLKAFLALETEFLMATGRMASPA